METQKGKPVGKTYMLVSEAKTLSVRIKTKRDKNGGLLHHDGKEYLEIRYAKNYLSPYVRDQKGEVLLESVYFEDGGLYVPKENQALQNFLAVHPDYGVVFIEKNMEKNAKKDNKTFDIEFEASSLARQLPLDQFLAVARIFLGEDLSETSTPEIRRDVYIKIKQEAALFLQIANKPELESEADAQTFLDKKLLTLRKNDTQIWYNLKSKKTKMIDVDEEFHGTALEYLSSYLVSEEGESDLELLTAELSLIQ